MKETGFKEMVERSVHYVLNTSVRDDWGCGLFVDTVFGGSLS